MRWKSSKGRQYNTTREKQGFLILPKCIEHEWRWWEHATWKQKWTIKTQTQYGAKCKWRNLCWVDKTIIDKEGW
jgi:hypothetical protein